MAGGFDFGGGGRLRPFKFVAASLFAESCPVRGLLEGLTGRGGDLEPPPPPLPPEPPPSDDGALPLPLPVRPAWGRVGDRLPLAEGRARAAAAAFPSPERCVCVRVGPVGERERRLPSRTSLVVCGRARARDRDPDPDPDRSRDVDGDVGESPRVALVGVGVVPLECFSDCECFLAASRPLLFFFFLPFLWLPPTDTHSKQTLKKGLHFRQLG